MLPGYRSICDLGKIRQVGWRNFSVWGLFGLLGVAGGIPLASIRTENGNLWFTIGLKRIGDMSLWYILSAKRDLWDFLIACEAFCIKLVALVLPSANMM